MIQTKYGRKMDLCIVGLPIIETDEEENKTRICPALWPTRIIMKVLNFYSVSNED